MNHTPRVLILAAGLAGVIVALAPIGRAQQVQSPPPQSQQAPQTSLTPLSVPGGPVVKITSPQGRTGLSGKIRIVARIQTEPGTVLSPVEFFVDGKLIGTAKDGPPYAVMWTDENPQTPAEIVVTVADVAGRIGRDVIDLKAYEPTFKSGIESVYLEPSVIDPSGRRINGLTEADFQVFENDERQTIDMLLPDVMPVTYTLLVDSSQSMSRRMDFVRDAARTVLDHLRPHDQIIVAPFKKTIGTITGPTRDRSTVIGAIDAIDSSGGTAILNALVEASSKLSVAETRQVIVLITDGYDENSDIDTAKALQAVKGASSTIYVVGVAGVAGISLKGEDLLKSLANETGGRAFFPAREIQLGGVYDLISTDVQQRYLLTYTPTNQEADGSWRAITVKTTTPGWIVRVRAGYRAPSPPPVRPQIEMTARDLNRVPVDVSADDLIVTEDGVAQKIEAFEETVAPVSIMLVLDSSGSMRKDAAAVMEAARSFVNALPDKDSLGVMTFADRPKLIQDLSGQRLSVLHAIDKYQAIGGTALYDAIAEAATRLKQEDGRRAIVVLTDGKDENNPGTAPGSVRTLAEAVALVKETASTVFAIGLGPKVDQPTLETLVQSSGGESYYPQDVSTLANEYHRVLEDLRRRFIIRYTSTNSKYDGTWRTVQVSSRRQGVVISSQTGYRAPTKVEK